jgi:hypothetical protein
LGENANILTNENNNKKEGFDKKIICESSTEDEMYDKFDTFDIQNTALKSIVLRLMQNCLYNDPQIRSCCIDGLGF